jgi:excisionase family DNA binding protein
MTMTKGTAGDSPPEPGEHEDHEGDARLTLHEAAEQLGVHYATIRRWVAEGRLRAHKQGPRLVRIYQSDLDKVIQPAVPLSVRKAAEARAAKRENSPARKRGQARRK